MNAEKTSQSQPLHVQPPAQVQQLPPAQPAVHRGSPKIAQLQGYSAIANRHPVVQRTSFIIGYKPNDDMFQGALNTLIAPNPIYAFTESGEVDNSALTTAMIKAQAHKPADPTKLNIIAHGGPGELGSIPNLAQFFEKNKATALDRNVQAIDLYACYAMMSQEVGQSVAYQIAKWAQTHLDEKSQQTIRLKTGLTSNSSGLFAAGKPSFQALDQRTALHANPIDNYLYKKARAALHVIKGRFHEEYRKLILAELPAAASFATTDLVEEILKLTPERVWADKDTHVEGETFTIRQQGIENEPTLRYGYFTSSLTDQNLESFPERLCRLESLDAKQVAPMFAQKVDVIVRGFVEKYADREPPREYNPNNARSAEDLGIQFGAGPAAVSSAVPAPGPLPSPFPAPSPAPSHGPALAPSLPPAPLFTFGGMEPTFGFSMDNVAPAAEFSFGAVTAESGANSASNSAPAVVAASNTPVAVAASTAAAAASTPALGSSNAIANGSAQVHQLQAYHRIANSPPTHIPESLSNGGLPAQLQSGIESLSGIAMDDVHVHYNSSKPAQLQAHAYAQGTDIHIAPGQERHLPHEAWHVVQQKQGRVKPTLQLKGVAINDDSALEREADVMGEKLQHHTAAIHPVQLQTRAATAPLFPSLRTPLLVSYAIQRRKILTTNDGELDTDRMTRAEIIAIYRKLVKAKEKQSVMFDLEKAISKREYTGAEINLETIRKPTRSLLEIINDNIKVDYHPNFDEEHTVGLEVEFGYHENAFLNFTHIELARSKQAAWINGLPFKLETDSGNTVEIVTPPLWMNAEEEDEVQAELETFAKNSVRSPITIAQWTVNANKAYPMALEPAPVEEIRAGANMYNVDEGMDISTAIKQSKSAQLLQDIGKTVLITSKKDPTGAHTQRNKAISIAEYGKSRSDLYAKIRKDFSPFTAEPEFLKEFLASHKLWDDRLSGPNKDINAVNALIALAKRKIAKQAPDASSAAYLWQSHMQSVTELFLPLAKAIPEAPNPFGVPSQDNTGAVCILIGEKSVTGALGTIGENLESILQKHAFNKQDPTLLKVQDSDSHGRKTSKALAGWHTHVKDIMGNWFKGDLRQVLLNERVTFPASAVPDQIEAVVITEWKKRLPVLMVPYYKTLEMLGVEVDGGGRITTTSEAWFKLPLPDPFMYLREWEKVIRSICQLIDRVTLVRKQGKEDASFKAPGFLQNFNTNLYNAREDTMISSQYIIRYPQGGEYQYVVEKR